MSNPNIVNGNVFESKKEPQPIRNQMQAAPSWLRPPDPNCKRCRGRGVEGKVSCHCVTRKEYSPKFGPIMTIKE